MSSQEIPDWASYYNYYWHSNPLSKHFSKVVFDKSFVRPQVDLAWETLKNKNSGTKQKEHAQSIIDKYAYDSAPMCMGRTVQTICDARLLPLDELQRIYQTTDRLDIEKKARMVMELYDGYEFQYRDDEKANLCRDALDETVANAVKGLEEAHRILGLNQMEGEKDVFIEDIKGMDLRYFYKPDFSSLIELKIRTPQMRNTKKGYAKGSIPKDPYPSWLNQVSAYHHYTKRQPALVVANDVEYKIFHPDEGDFFTSPDNLIFTWDNIAQDCRLRERVMKHAHQFTIQNNLDQNDSLYHLFQSVIPDWKDISWSNLNPVVLEEAKYMWGY